MSSGENLTSYHLRTPLNDFIWLRSSFGASKLNYHLRFPPCSDQQTLLVRTRLEPILNCSLKDIKWLQSVLSIEAGLFAAGFIGLVGLSRIESLTISSCSSSHL